MKVAVFGSRTLKDERVKVIILEKIHELKATMIVTTQEPSGVCEVAQRVAKEHAIPLELHFLNFKYLRGAFEHRSKEVVRVSDYFIIIHDGESKGTANELKMVKKSGKPYHYEILKPEPHQNNVGFNIMKEWTLTEDEKESEQFTFDFGE
jgi:hypothetical protein